MTSLIGGPFSHKLYYTLNFSSFIPVTFIDNIKKYTEKNSLKLMFPRSLAISFSRKDSDQISIHLATLPLV